MLRVLEAEVGKLQQWILVLFLAQLPADSDDDSDDEEQEDLADRSEGYVRRKGQEKRADMVRFVNTRV